MATLFKPDRPYPVPPLFGRLHVVASVLCTRVEGVPLAFEDANEVFLILADDFGVGRPMFVGPMARASVSASLRSTSRNGSTGSRKPSPLVASSEPKISPPSAWNTSCTTSGKRTI